MKRLVHLFIVLSIGIVLLSCTERKGSAPRVEQGTLNLGTWDFDKDGLVKLHGEWAFYWNRLVPYSDLKQSNTNPDVYLDIPGLWNNLELSGQKLPGQGYATFHTRVRLPKNKADFGIKFYNAGTAAEIYVNGKHIGQSGKVGTDAASSHPAYIPHIAEFTLSDTTKVADIYIYVSNYQHRKGGLWDQLFLGTRQQAHSLRQQHLYFEFFLIGSILIIALYHAGLYFIRKSDRSPLYFSLFCFSLLLRSGLTGEHCFNLFFDFDWNWKVRLEYISFYMASPFFALFLNSLFPKEFPKHITAPFIATGILSTLLTLVTPVLFFSHLMIYFQAFTILGGIYAIGALIVALWRKQQGALVFLFGWLFFFFTIVNDILYQNDMIETGSYTTLGLFVFIFAQAFLLSTRISKAFTDVEKLSVALDQTNAGLEKHIESRTFELYEKNKELEKQRNELQKQKSVVQQQNKRYEAASKAILEQNARIKEQNKQVMEATEKFSILFQESTEAHLLYNGQIMDCNKATLELFNCHSKADLLQCNLLDISPELQPPPFDDESGDGDGPKIPSAGMLSQHIDDCQEQGRVRFDWTFKTKKGKEFPSETTFTKVRFQTNEVLLVVIHNLTERMITQMQLRETHRELIQANQEVVANFIMLEKQNDEIAEQKNEIEAQKDLIEYKSKQLTSSINYASSIQEAILTPRSIVRAMIPDHFIFYKPRDIVSGDFYWFRKFGFKIFLAAADCTGHGVPGAFMSMMGISFLNDIVSNSNYETLTASYVLESLRMRVKTSLRQTGREGESQDGMDISFCIFDEETMNLQYAGANNPIYIVRQNGFVNTDLSNPKYKLTENQHGQLLQVSADRMPIGIYVRENPFTNHNFQLKPYDVVYLFSDGFIDQIGGDKNRKFMQGRFKQFLLEIQDCPIEEQGELLEQVLDTWRNGRIEQIDDVLVMGFQF